MTKSEYLQAKAFYLKAKETLDKIANERLSLSEPLRREINATRLHLEDFDYFLEMEPWS